MHPSKTFVTKKISSEKMSEYESKFASLIGTLEKDAFFSVEVFENFSFKVKSYKNVKDNVCKFDFLEELKENKDKIIAFWANHEADFDDITNFEDLIFAGGSSRLIAHLEDIMFAEDRLDDIFLDGLKIEFNHAKQEKFAVLYERLMGLDDLKLLLLFPDEFADEKKRGSLLEQSKSPENEKKIVHFILFGISNQIDLVRLLNFNADIKKDFAKNFASLVDFKSVAPFENCEDKLQFEALKTQFKEQIEELRLNIAEFKTNEELNKIEGKIQPTSVVEALILFLKERQLTVPLDLDQRKKYIAYSNTEELLKALREVYEGKDIKIYHFIYCCVRAGINGIENFNKLTADKREEICEDFDKLFSEGYGKYEQSNEKRKQGKALNLKLENMLEAARKNEAPSILYKSFAQEFQSVSNLEFNLLIDDAEMKIFWEKELAPYNNKNIHYYKPFGLDLRRHSDTLQNDIHDGKVNNAREYAKNFLSYYDPVSPNKSKNGLNTALNLGEWESIPFILTEDLRLGILALQNEAKTRKKLRFMLISDGHWFLLTRDEHGNWSIQDSLSSSSGEAYSLRQKMFVKAYLFLNSAGIDEPITYRTTNDQIDPFTCATRIANYAGRELIPGYVDKDHPRFIIELLAYKNLNINSLRENLRKKFLKIAKKYGLAERFIHSSAAKKADESRSTATTFKIKKIPFNNIPVIERQSDIATEQAKIVHSASSLPQSQSQQQPSYEQPSPTALSLVSKESKITKSMDASSPSSTQLSQEKGKIPEKTLAFADASQGLEKKVISVQVPTETEEEAVKKEPVKSVETDDLILPVRKKSLFEPGSVDKKFSNQLTPEGNELQDKELQGEDLLEIQPVNPEVKVEEEVLPPKEVLSSVADKAGKNSSDEEAQAKAADQTEQTLTQPINQQPIKGLSTNTNSFFSSEIKPKQPPLTWIYQHKRINWEDIPRNKVDFKTKSAIDFQDNQSALTKNIASDPTTAGWKQVTAPAEEDSRVYTVFSSKNESEFLGNFIENNDLKEITFTVGEFPHDKSAEEKAFFARAFLLQGLAASLSYGSPALELGGENVEELSYLALIAKLIDLPAAQLILPHGFEPMIDEDMKAIYEHEGFKASSKALYESLPNTLYQPQLLEAGLEAEGRRIKPGLS